MKAGTDTAWAWGWRHWCGILETAFPRPFSNRRGPAQLGNLNPKLERRAFVALGVHPERNVPLLVAGDRALIALVVDVRVHEARSQHRVVPSLLCRKLLKRRCALAAVRASHPHAVHHLRH